MEQTSRLSCGGGVTWFLLWLRELYLLRKGSQESLHLLLGDTGSLQYCVMILWVVFRAENLGAALAYIHQMFSIESLGTGVSGFVMYLMEMKIELAICAIISFVSIPKIILETALYKGIKATAVFALFFASVSYLVKGNYSLFLYFNF